MSNAKRRHRRRWRARRRRWNATVHLRPPYHGPHPTAYDRFMGALRRYGEEMADVLNRAFAEPLFPGRLYREAEDDAAG